MAFEEFEELQADRLVLRLVGDALRHGAMFGNLVEEVGSRESSLFSQGATERPMHGEVGVAADGAGEMAVIGFGESVVPQRLRGVARALERTQQARFEKVFFGRAGNAFEELLDFAARVRMADGVAEGAREFAPFLQFLGIGVFMDAGKDGDFPTAKLGGDGLVGEEHELLDELMGHVVFDLLDLLRNALGVAAHLDLGKVQFERALGETPRAKFRRKFPQVADQSRNFFGQ